MAATLISQDADEIVIQVRIPKSRDFLQCESLIQDALNDAGRLATAKCLEEFDADGSPIVCGGAKLTAKRTKIARKYETPYGTVAVERFAYQSPKGGEVFIPLERDARIIGGTTPRFARIVSYTYSHCNSSVVQATLLQTLNRSVSRCYIQDVAGAVAAHVEDHSRAWDYAESEPAAEAVAVVAIGIDGTSLFFCEDGFRQAMVGTITLYDDAGERLHTNHVAAAPEHGKASFLSRMDEEIARIKRKYPRARYVGVSDGAPDYLPWLRGHTTTRVLDFWHVTEYLHAAAAAVHPGQARREAWLAEACHALKREHGSAGRILAELRAASGRKLPSKAREGLQAAISYFGNNLGRMNYASYLKSRLPIGSGVTEAACKSVVKIRMCGPGMKWTQRGSDSVLTLRALSLSPERWAEFWTNVAAKGVAAPFRV